MPQTHLHSFVILAYKDSPYLEKCLVSLQQQTVQSEIIISTSTPSAFLENIATQYHIPLCVNEAQGGIAADWSFAYQQGATSYITLAHQDDLYMPQYTEICLAAAERNPATLIAFTDYREMANGQLRKDHGLLWMKRLMLFPYYLFKQNLSTPWLKTLMLSPGNPVCCPSVMYRKNKIGAFEFDASFAMNLDWEAWLRLARMTGDFIYIKKTLLLRRIHPESESTVTLRNNTRQREDRLIFERLWPQPVASALHAIYARAYESNETTP